ncbi:MULTISPECIES: FBP domain-containing protein [Streptomyces]|uniref:FBP domain-containing protein n=1 Tax=Streptomyces evansiae TaxID=3075535 RepID=A0ABU2R4D7_9ACTN|nr:MULTISPECIES: FBP domain-containing protein [unclassified Streptomyces]EFL00766.1 conserved hypothetical protein [Streptomyces sp. SPB78]MDT0411557.1 FBP domain-containing protein [Streptomyces sp. DSM 41979]MYQ61607.1 FBP domain-containing protein [Streptomyces sp. SID4926]SCD78274.1 FBP C-terminal treble-clef zinc-finger [Streptomyces sp. DfronAA-171]
MKPLTDPEIRAAFVNCSKGEAKRLHIPRDLAERPWDDLDYFGWRDPQAPDRAYLATVVDGRALALTLRRPATAAWQTRRGMCSICLTPHSGGVALMVAPRAGKAGKAGNSVGTYLCEDLACPLYVRGKKDVGSDRMHESLTVEEKVARMMANLDDFVGRVLTGEA